MTPSRPDTQLPLKHLGIDSLTAMALRRKVELDLGIVLPRVRLLSSTTRLGSRHRLVTSPPAQLRRPDPTVAADTRGSRAPAAAKTEVVGSRWMDLRAQVPEVSDDDVDELLREILAAREGQDGRPLGWARDPL